MQQNQNKVSQHPGQNKKDNLQTNYPLNIQDHNPGFEHYGTNQKLKSDQQKTKFESQNKNANRQLFPQQSATQQKIHQQNLAQNSIISQSDMVHRESKCRQTKKIIYGVIFTLIVLIVGIGMAIYFSKPPDYKPQFILKRILQKYKVFETYITIVNTMKTQKSDQQIIMRINYTFIVAIKQNIARQINCICSISKGSQQRILSNGSIVQVQKFNQSSIFLDILKGQSINSALDNQGIPIDTYKPILNQYDTSSFRQNQTVKFLAAVYPVFKFSLRFDGSIVNITFPKQTQKQLLGILKGFIKMFSPLIKTQLYQSGNNIQKQKKVNGKLVSQTQNSTDQNQTLKENLLYSEQNVYKYEIDQNRSIIITNLAQINVTGPSHNTRQVTSQESYFNQEGELINSKASSNTTFSSLPQQHDENSSAINLTIFVTSSQKAQMNLSKFQTLKRYIQQFEGFIKTYQQKNQTITFNSTQLVNYILNNSNRNLGNPEQIRLLKQTDGSYSLVEYEKQIKISKSNFLGCKIGVQGVVKMNVLLQQHKKNQYIKYPIIKVYIGNILTLGFFKFQSPLLQYQKLFPPLTLKFTLEKIQSVFQQYKGNFIQNIQNISKLIISGDYQKYIFPSILNISSSLSNIHNTVQEQINLKSPIEILQKIYKNVNTIEQTIQTKEKVQIDSKNEFIANVSKQLLKYVNASYDDSLKEFNNVKTNLTTIKTNGNIYFQNAIETFEDTDMFKIGVIFKALVPDQVFQQYKQEMQKAKQIINFIEYVKQNSLAYKDFLTNTLIDHKQNYLQFAEKIINLYFKNQNLTIIKLKADTLNYYMNVNTQFKNLSDSLSQNLQVVKNKSQTLFESILHQKFISSYFSKTYLKSLDQISKILAGISNEAGGDCCRYKRTWYGRKYCATWNPSKNNQRSQATRYKTLNSQVMAKFFSLAQQTQSLIQLLQSVLKSTKSLPQKYLQLVAMKQKITNFSNNYIDEVISKITARKNHALSIRRSIICGGASNINIYNTQLNLMMQLSTELKIKFQQFKQNYTKVIDQFKPQIFDLIVQNTEIIQSASNFFKAYQQNKNKTINHISQIEEIVQSLNPQQFASSTKIINNISNLYNYIRQNLINPCLTKQRQYETINSIRKQYLIKFQNINDTQNDFFNEELKNLKQYIFTSSQILFDTYQQITFCDMYQFFNDTITNLEPDLDNLKILFHIFSNFSKLKSTTELQLINTSKQISKLLNSFYQLFTPQGYRQFINETQNITNFFQTLVFNTSQQLSTLRQQSKSVYILTMAQKQYLTQSIDIFIESQFALDYTTMFSNYDVMRERSQSIVDELNFDIIAVVIQGKQILQYYSNSITIYQQGLLNLKQEFQIITSGFLNINALTTQNTLNNYRSRSNKMTNTINQTLFGTFFDDVEYIKNKYVDLGFKNEQLKKMHTNSLAKFKDFSDIVFDVKQVVYKDIQMFSIKQLIDKLYIVSLNSLYQLGNSISKQFQSSMKILKQSSKQILTFENLVVKDFKNLFKFPKILIQIQKKIQNQYQLAFNSIKTKLNQTESNLNKNLKFYSKFKKSKVYKQIQMIPEQLNLQFRNIWDYTQDSLRQINDFLKGISQQVFEVMNPMNQAKLEIESTIKSVKGRINNIKEEFKIVNGKLFNLKQLIFITVTTDLDIIKNSLQSIIQQIDTTVDVDLNVLSNLSKKVSNGKLSFIQQTLNKTISQYSHLKQISSDFIQGINQGLKAIQDFKKTQLSITIKSLKQGMIFIKACTNFQNPQQTFRVFEKSFHKQRISVYNYRQIVPTSIGGFNIDFDINFFIGISTFVDVLQFRTIDIKSNFTSEFQISASFSYSLTNIFEFALYTKGPILISILYPQFLCVNCLPYQLVKPIANVSQIYSNNVGQLTFISNLTIKDVDIQIGFFNKNIQIKWIWLKTKFCNNNQKLSKLCINLKIPIGYRFTYERNDFGELISNEPILNKRILSIPVDTFQM